MKLIVDNNPEDILDLKEDKWAYVYAALSFSLVGSAFGAVLCAMFGG